MTMVSAEGADLLESPTQRVREVILLNKFLVLLNNFPPNPCILPSSTHRCSPGKRQGRGEYIWPNGDRYTGDFAEGVKHGNGILYFANGDKRVS